MKITRRHLRHILKDQILFEQSSEQNYSAEAYYNKLKNRRAKPNPGTPDKTRLTRSIIQKGLASSGVSGIKMEGMNKRDFSVKFDTDFFEGVKVKINFPYMQALVMNEFDEKQNSPDKSIAEIFSKIKNQLNEYTDDFKKLVLSNRIKKLIKNAKNKGYENAQKDFDAAFDSFKRGLTLTVGYYNANAGAGPLPPSEIYKYRASYNLNKDVYAAPSISFDLSTFYHEFQHRHRFKFDEFNKNVDYYMEERNPLTSLWYGPESWKGSSKSGEEIEDKYSDLDLTFLENPPLAPLDYDTKKIHNLLEPFVSLEPERIKRLVAGNLKGEDIVSTAIRDALHNYQDCKNPLYHLQSNHITETISMLGKFADESNIDTFNDSEAKQFVKKWLEGKLDIPEKYHQLADMEIVLLPSEKNINYFVKYMNRIAKTTATDDTGTKLAEHIIRQLIRASIKKSLSK